MEATIKTLATEGEIANLPKEPGQVKADRKWLFIFWIGQIGAIAGILFVFFKK